MAQDMENGATAIDLWAASYGNDENADLVVEYSVNHGTTWNTLGDFTVTRGSLQHYTLDIDVQSSVRFRIRQSSGSRVNIDDITIQGRAQQTYIDGDVNGDGEVNIADVNAVLDIVLGGEADQATTKRADVNHDGEIGIADVNSVIDIILGL